MPMVRFINHARYGTYLEHGVLRRISSNNASTMFAGVGCWHFSNWVTIHRFSSAILLRNINVNFHSVRNAFTVNWSSLITRIDVHILALIFLESELHRSERLVVAHRRLEAAGYCFVFTAQTVFTAFRVKHWKR